MTVLSRHSVRSRARRLHYMEVPSYDDRVLSFVHNRKAGCGDKKHRYGSVKVDVDFVDGEVTTSLNHERSGHTKLARMVDSHNQLEKILKNPRIHTGIGYHVGTQNEQENDGYGDEDDWEDEEDEEDDSDWEYGDGWAPDDQEDGGWRGDYEEDDGWGWDDEDDWDWDDGSYGPPPYGPPPPFYGPPSYHSSYYRHNRYYPPY